jgi:hypothetical protein
MSKVTDYLASMEADVSRTDCWTKEQAEEWASRYWAIRWDKSLTEDQQKEALAKHDAEFKPVRDVSTSEEGNTIVRRHRDAERYLFDFDEDFRAAGWLQFDTDQDAWYFGVWVNPKTLRTLSYAEGDVTLVICPDAEHYNAEVKHACEFYGQGFEFIETNIEGFQQLMLGGEVPGAEGVVHRQDRQGFFAVL